ncbi:MAG: ROK family glucokinase [Alicyclobacillus sp.]|nr:ROK family glucokinase [Alicyclobacillus sp.]
MIWLGVDVGGTHVKTALISGDGQPLVKQSFDTHPELGVEEFSDRLKAVVQTALASIGRDWSEVRGVGVGVPGFLDIDRGVIVEAVNLGWKDVPFVEVLERRLGLPLAMENDANVAALGEAWVGAGRGAASVLCVTVGTGVGGGIVLGGRLYRGVNGLAGEIGHLVVDRGGIHCNCGKFGCLETVASATAIVREARHRQAAGEIPADAVIEGAEDVFRLARAGSEAARRVVEEAARWLGYGLALCADTLNPDAIVIGGGVSKAKDEWMVPVRAAFEEYALPLASQAAKLQVAELGNDAGVIGAARLIAQKLGADG